MPTGVYPHSEEQKKRARAYRHTPEAIEKIRKSSIGRKHMIGKKHSDATKKKMGVSQKGKTGGDKNWRWKGGRPHCLDCGKQIYHRTARCWDCYNKFSVKENHWNWKGGISRNPYPKRFNAKLKLKIRRRDNFICCLCGRTEREELEELNRVLCVNHIDFNKNNCKENNLNTLCLRCNVRINREREYWTTFFQNYAPTRQHNY